jgi:hypothetical protein
MQNEACAYADDDEKMMKISSSVDDPLLFIGRCKII